MVSQHLPPSENEKGALPKDVIPGESGGNGSDQDIALEVVGEHSQGPLDPVAEARVVRKIDWWMIPIMTIGYGLVYYDKV